MVLWISHGWSETKGREHLVYTGITKPNTRNKKGTQPPGRNWTVDPERNLNKLPGCIQEELTSFSSCPLFGTLILAKYCVNWKVKATCGTSYHPRFQWSTPHRLRIQTIKQVVESCWTVQFASHFFSKMSDRFTSYFTEQISKWAEVNVPVSLSVGQKFARTERILVFMCEMSCKTLAGFVPLKPKWMTRELRVAVTQDALWLGRKTSFKLIHLDSLQRRNPAVIFSPLVMHQITNIPFLIKPERRFQH